MMRKTDLKRERCGRCGETLTEGEIDDITQILDHGDRYQPPEYGFSCPNPKCHATHDEYEEVFICEIIGCENDATEDDLCTEHFTKLMQNPDPDPGAAVDWAEYMMEDR